MKGSKPGHGSGFDIDEDDLSELDKYYDVIVASAIFGSVLVYTYLFDIFIWPFVHLGFLSRLFCFSGNYDVIQEPENISDAAKENVPFFMFIDEETEEYMRNKSVLTSSKMVGLWRIIVVRDIPYNDSRRNGKVKTRLVFLHLCFGKNEFS